MAALVEVLAVSKRFGGFYALSDVSLEIQRGERVGLIGPNGSGKTTLISCIAGGHFLDGGRILFDGQDVSRLPAYRRTRLGIVRSFQIPHPFSTMTVLENLYVPLEYTAHRGELAASDVRGEGMQLLEQFGLHGKAEVISGNLTQIELRKLELARAVAAKPSLLISDEAMAGLSSSEVEEVLQILFRLSAEGITILMIEHIMQAVMRFSQRVICLDAGRVVIDAEPNVVMASPDVRRTYLGA